MSGRRERIPELDGLRVLMIFIVSWYHIWQQSWLRPMLGSYSLDYLVRSGYVWVDGTVLLSSFLLFLPYAQAMRDDAPPPDTRSFYFRRARRILPGYYFIILAVFFGIALPWKLYGSAPYMVKDVATHLTFTFPFFYDTYIATPLGAASWTLAIEVQAYALFPLVARGVMKRPAAVLSLLFAVCFGFRARCVWGLTEYSMVVNQLLNFLDVYAVGMLAAMAFVRLRARAAKVAVDRKKRLPAQALATVLFLLVFWALLQMLRFQATSKDYVEIQRRQMIYRPVYALCFTGLVLTAPFALRPLRMLLGNPVTPFLGGISMNYYLIHQTIIVHMKRLHFPPSVSDEPHMAGEQPWQTQYTLLAFGLSLLLAILVTYAVEKPAGRLLDRWAKKRLPPAAAVTSEPAVSGQEEAPRP